MKERISWQRWIPNFSPWVFLFSFFSLVLWISKASTRQKNILFVYGSFNWVSCNARTWLILSSSIIYICIRHKTLSKWVSNVGTLSIHKPVLKVYLGSGRLASYHISYAYWLLLRDFLFFRAPLLHRVQFSGPELFGWYNLLNWNAFRWDGNTSVVHSSYHYYFFTSCLHGFFLALKTFTFIIPILEISLSLFAQKKWLISYQFIIW